MSITPVDRDGATATPVASPVLAVNNLEVVYSDVMLVLRGVSLEMPGNSIVAMLGSNCAGKTTLLRAITGLLTVHRGKITKGTIEFQEREIHHQDAPEGTSAAALIATRTATRSCASGSISVTNTSWASWPVRGGSARSSTARAATVTCASPTTRTFAVATCWPASRCRC
jgi:ABC-type cobalamin/Fe3+-siderophores transport system ATPase subunit